MSQAGSLSKRPANVRLVIAETVRRGPPVRRCLRRRPRHGPPRRRPAVIRGGRPQNMNAPSFSLAGRRALVTGSSQGIGLALAAALAGAGAQVVLNGRDAAKLAAAATGLRSAGHASVEVVSF